MNYDGTIHADRVYTDQQILQILNISEDQLNGYYKGPRGLRYFQKTRQQKRLISGAEFHRFIERNQDEWPSEDGDDE